jgi:hypothetical protein
MKHLKIFEAFSADKSPVCKIVIPSCNPWNCDDFSGYWALEEHIILVEVEVPGIQNKAASVARELFDFDLEDYVLPSILKGKFKIESTAKSNYGYSEGIDKVFNEPFIIKLAEESEDLDDFADTLRREMVDMVIQDYEESCGRSEAEYDEDDDEYNEPVINTGAVEELMKDYEISWPGIFFTS